MIKTFRGQLADAGIDRIRLSTIKGKVGYRVVKFQAMPRNFNTTDEYNLTIWQTLPTLATTFDFTDANLLGALYFENSTAATESPTTGTIIFDNEIINQDIYIGLKSQSGNACNYYLELEVIELSEQGAEYTTIKDLRSS